MKARIGSLLVLGLILVAAPAVAQVVYSNGPTNGNTDAWPINFGYVVSDTFNVQVNESTITSASFAMWLYPGDTLTSAQLSITSLENGGTVYYQLTDSFTQSGCVGNQYGYNVCNETTTLNGPTLNIGTYWLNLTNASVPSGDPIYWDENSGPSQASESAVGSIPSESFTVMGTCNIDDKGPVGCTTTSTSTSTTGTSIPEPSSILLLGSGILGLAGWTKRKFF